MELSVYRQRVSVIIPSKNELESLLITVPFLFSATKTVSEVIIVVDSQDDNSLELPSHLNNEDLQVSLLLNSDGGVFGAIALGVMSANFDKCIVLPADELLPILKIDEMVGRLSDDCRFVSATRNRNGGKRYGGNLTGKWFSKCGNFVLRKLYPSTISDFTTGIKAFYKRDWELLSKGAEGKGWSCSLAFTLNAIRNNIGVAEIPVISVDRFAGGNSSFSLRRWLWSYTRIVFKGY